MQGVNARWWGHCTNGTVMSKFSVCVSLSRRICFCVTHTVQHNKLSSQRVGSPMFLFGNPGANGSCLPPGFVWDIRLMPFLSSFVRSIVMCFVLCKSQISLQVTAKRAAAARAEFMNECCRLGEWEDAEAFGSCSVARWLSWSLNHNCGLGFIGNMYDLVCALNSLVCLATLTCVCARN
jgi:hypothetical protein